MTSLEVILAWCGSTELARALGIADTLIGLAYVSIPAVIMAYAYKRRRSLDWRWLVVAVCGVLFILGCGSTHFVHAATRLDPSWITWAIPVHFFTAGISALTAAVCWPLLPYFLAVPTPAEYLAKLDELRVALAERDQAVAKLHGRQELLVRELNHRARNNLAILQSILRNMKRTPSTARMTHDELLTVIENRFGAIVRVHDRIYSSADESTVIEVPEFVGSICQDLAGQFRCPVATDLDPLQLSLDESVPVAMLVNELVTNAMKYGRRNSECARASVSFKREDGHWRLEVADQGPGFVASPRPKSFGMKLVQRLAEQVGGALEVASGPDGTTLTVRGVRNRHDFASAAG